MENKGDKEFVRSIRRADVYMESTAEYTLPDYNGDIRKLLFTEAEVRPAGKFAGDGEVEFSGIVVYNIIYSDNDGKLSSTSFTSDYEHTVKCSAESYADAFCDTRVANFGVRLVGPRKISAKASVVGSVTLCERDAIEVEGSAFTGDSDVEVLEQTAMIRNTSASQTVEREYAETVATLDGAIADEVQVIYSGADVDLDDVDVEDGAVKIEGELTLYAVIRNGSEPAYLARREIEIEEILPYEGVNEDMRLIPEAVVVSLKDSVNATENGSEVVLSAIVEYSVRGERNTPVSIVSDAYMQTCVTENTYEDFCYSEFADFASAETELCGDMDRDSVEAAGLREVVCFSAVPKVEGVSCSDDTVAVSGEIRFSGVVSAMSDDGAISYHGVKFSTPFTENVKLSCQTNEKMRVEPKIALTDVRGSLDASKVYGSCKMTVSVLATEERSARALASCNAREDLPFEKHPARVTVYYPDKSETLFSVAKKFHTTPAKVSADNSLTADVSTGGGAEVSLAGVKRLIIT